jgi:hypothetical protein
MDINGSLDGSDARTLQKHSDRENGLFGCDGHRSKRLRVGLSERLAALTATEPA